MSPTRSAEPELPFERESEATNDRPRRLHPVWSALLWLIVIVLALSPIPWW